MADGLARPLSLHLTEGQKGDSPELPAVLAGVRVARAGRGRPRTRPTLLLLDRGYTGKPCRSLLRRKGIRHRIPEKRDEQERRQQKGRKGGRPAAFDKSLYAKRNVVERCILRLKQFRRVATRYEKTAESYLGMVTLASIILWLR